MKHWSFVMLFLALLPGLAAAVSDHGAADYAVLVRDDTMSLQLLLEITTARYPQSVVLPALMEQAEAWQNKGNSLLAGQPLLAGRYQGDQFNADEGLEELEAGLKVPLWNRGERHATRKLGVALGEESSAAVMVLSLEVAYLLRNLLWDFRMAESNLELARRALETAKQRSAALQRRFELGDISLADTILASTEVLDRETLVVEAEAEFVDASRMYYSITGTPNYPAVFEEKQSTRTEIGEDHPLVMLARARLERADAGRSYRTLEAKSNPTLTVGPRSERVSSAIEAQKSIGVQIEIPFGGRSHIWAEASAVEREYAEAQAAFLQLERDLDVEIHEAEHELLVVRQKADLATQRLALVTRHLAMGEVAFENGEMDLLALLLLQSNADNASREAAGITIEVQRAIAMYNQVVGDLP